ALADAVVVPRARASEATARLAEASLRVGRRRGDIAVLGRVELPPDHTIAERTAAQLADWVERYGFDGLELALTRDHDRLLAVVRALVPRLGPSGGATLRAALGLPEPIGAGS
ncbi:hypothetical protein JBE27_39915, partial [Streptomyces albiflaviniger]|nr:hypothetical protein [Streptomyces albiflaviniger]